MTGITLFQGLSAFPITPMDARGVVDTGTLGAILDPLAASGVGSIGLLGSTGTYMFLDLAERRRALATAVRTVAGRVPLIVGIGATRTDWVCELARDAEATGADALLLAPVSYTPLTDAEVFAHYRAVAEASALPLCIYNNPTTTHFAFSDALLARLSHLETVRAVKMPLPADGDYAGQLARLRAACAPGFAIGYSGDWGASDALLAGADGFFSVAAGLLPAPMLALARAARSGDAEAAAQADARLAPLWALFKRHGSVRVMHVIAGLLGHGDLQPPRPLLPLDAAARSEIEAVLAPLRD